MSEKETRQLNLFDLGEGGEAGAPGPPVSSKPQEIREEAPPGYLVNPPPAVERAPTGPAPLTPAEKETRILALKERALGCTACGLSATRQNVVFGEGNLQSPLVIVGEGPGEQEDATGRPFVGRAGTLLDAVLRDNGILRQHVYICNVVKCRACIMESARVKNRAPRLEEVEACHPWLEQQLKLLSPLVILCLGSPAANWVIHPDFKILRERGIWFPTPWARAAMASLHPAFVLRKEGSEYESARATLVRDIGEARRKVIEIKKAEQEKG